MSQEISPSLRSRNARSSISFHRADVQASVDFDGDVAKNRNVKKSAIGRFCVNGKACVAFLTFAMVVLYYMNVPQRPRRLTEVLREESASLRHEMTKDASSSQHINTVVSSSADVTDVIPSDRHNYNFTASICAITRDDEAVVGEWIDYHLQALEFDRIYIFDNSDTFEMKRWYEHSRDHPIYSRVIVHHFPGKGYLDDREMYVQIAAYNDCVDWHGGDNDYLALIDTDEYLVPRHFFTKHRSIHAVLQEYLVPFGGALVVNWSIFGTSNKTRYSPLPITKRFQLRDAMPDGVIKTIVKSSDFNDSRNPHAVELIDGARVHTTMEPGHLQEEQFGITGASDHDKPDGVLLLHHYRFLSVKEYESKQCKRGSVDDRDENGCNPETGKLLTREEMEQEEYPAHLIPHPGDVHDDLAWRILTARVPKYRAFDNEEWWKDFE